MELRRLKRLGEPKKHYGGRKKKVYVEPDYGYGAEALCKLRDSVDAITHGTREIKQYMKYVVEMLLMLRGVEYGKG
jgi:hypothetical protein